VPEEFITIAKVVKTQGRHGEVAAEIHTDFPEKFSERKRLFAWLPDGSRRELNVEDHWPHKDRVVLKFAGVDDISAAEKLIGSELQVPLSERAMLEAGTYYISDLVGLRLLEQEREIGQVTGVEFGAGEAPNLVVKAASGGKEFLVPFAKAYLVNVDLESRQLEMRLPEGLLEVDAPLNQEEKRLQQKKN